MFESFCKEKLAPLTLRLALGGVFVFHGYVKIQDHGGAAWFPSMPGNLQMAIAWGELAAGLAILLGYRCRSAAATVLAITVGTLYWWQGWHVLQLPLKTLEPFLLLMLTGLSLLFLGAGELSLDARSGGGGARAASPLAKKKAA